MKTHYYTPRLPFKVSGENDNQAKKRRVRGLLKLAERNQPIFGNSPVFPYDPNDWQDEKQARLAAQAKADEMMLASGVQLIIISREIAKDVEKLRKGARSAGQVSR